MFSLKNFYVVGLTTISLAFGAGSLLAYNETNQEGMMKQKSMSQSKSKSKSKSQSQKSQNKNSKSQKSTY